MDVRLLFPIDEVDSEVEVLKDVGVDGYPINSDEGWSSGPSRIAFPLDGRVQII